MVFQPAKLQLPQFTLLILFGKPAQLSSGESPQLLVFAIRVFQGMSGLEVVGRYKVSKLQIVHKGGYERGGVVALLFDGSQGFLVFKGAIDSKGSKGGKAVELAQSLPGEIDIGGNGFTVGVKPFFEGKFSPGGGSSS